MKDDFLTKNEDLIDFGNLEKFKESEKFKLFLRLINQYKTNPTEKNKNLIIDLFDEMMQNKNICREVQNTLISIMKVNNLFKLKEIDFELKDDDIHIN